MNKLLIKNAKLITEFSVLDSTDVRICDGKIIETGHHLSKNEDEREYDSKGLYIAPGFIDLHVHGGAGSDFMDATISDFENIAFFHAKHGTTSMLATTLAAKDSELFEAIDCFNNYVKTSHKGANLIGLHLEGPYFSYEQRGAQDPKYLLSPKKEHYEKIMNSTPHIKRWSSAPELDGTDDFAKECIARNIILSVAHSSCTASQAKNAFDKGFKLITHFYSGMSGVVRKDSFRIAGLVEAGYLYDFKVELIADGCHLPSELLSLALKVKGEKNIALITDCSSAAGTGTSNSMIGSRKNGQPVIIDRGVAFLPDRTSFAGSIATTDRLLETILNLTPATIPQAIRMLSLTPAEILKIDNYKGKIAENYDADFVIFDYKDNKITVKDVFIGGNIVVNS